MTTIKFDIDTVTIKAAGVEAEIDVADWPENALADCMTYGIRRRFQDKLNSTAHAAKKADDDFDAQEAFDALIADYESGDIVRIRTTRAVDPLEKFILAVCRDLMAANKAFLKFKAAYDEIDSSDQKARTAYLLETVFEPHADVIKPAAQARLDAAQALASLDI